MAKSTKSYEERMLEMEKKEQESLEKAKQICSTEERTSETKERPRKVKNEPIGSVRLAVRWNPFLVLPIEEDDIPKLIGFLKRQEANGKFFSKAMQKETNTDTEEV